MTRARMFGSDVPFAAWCRTHAELPSEIVVMTDVDMFVHQYRTAVDGMGTREIQCMMEVEVKTRGGNLTSSQLDTYRKKHASIRRQCKLFSQTIRNYGVSVLRLEGTSPDDSEWIKWGRFVRQGPGLPMVERDITVDQLIGLMRFDLHPDSLEANPFRRHHKTRRLVETVTTPLGLQVEQEVIKRS